MLQENMAPRQGWSDEQVAGIRSAKSAYQDAERLVRQISAERLAELKIGHRVDAKVVTEDPTLTAADRVELVRWLGKRPAPPRWRLSVLRRLPRFRVRTGCIVVAVAAAAIPAALAWWNTPLGLVAFGSESVVHWHAGDRYVGMQGVKLGWQYDVTSVEDDTQTVRIRAWAPPAGYYHALVPFNLLNR